MTNTINIGIIGNYTGHLSGAESIEEHPLPNGIFVINCDHSETISSGNEANYPQTGTNVDIEPEFILRLKAQYENRKLVSLHPLKITIGNDFTVRTLEGSKKISERKSWGKKSKGIHKTWWDIKEFTPENYGKNLSLISYIERDGAIHCATTVADCTDTKLFCAELIDWTIDQVNNQKDHGMYEEILPQIEAMNFPEEFNIYTGAPNYTEWGTNNFISKGDKVHIAAFNPDTWTVDDIEDLFLKNKQLNDDSILCFSQNII